MSDIDFFLNNCLSVRETQGGGFRVYLEFDDCYKGNEGFDVACPLPGSFDHVEGDDDSATFKTGFNIFSDENSATEAEALEVLKEIKRSIKKTLRRLRKAKT